MYRPSELIEFLEKLKVRPKKGLSQNFLIDGNILKKIVDFAQVSPKDLVIEIGPGPGALTRFLLEAGAEVIAIEKDKTFAAHLPKNPRLTVFPVDFLKFPLEKHLVRKAKVVANLPYNITTPILSKIVPLYEKIESITVMVQKEVAHRFIAQPGTADYSSLTVFLNFYSTPVFGFNVSPNCFYPRPKVSSSVVQLKLHQPPEINSDEFFGMVRTAFQQRRKMLRSSLKIDDTRRPEELDLDDFLRLFKKIKEQSGDKTT